MRRVLAAAAGQNVRAARLLLKHGVEWTRRDKSGSSALHLCAELHTENVRRPRACVRACVRVCVRVPVRVQLFTELRIENLCVAHCVHVRAGSLVRACACLRLLLGDKDCPRVRTRVGVCVCVCVCVCSAW